MLFPEAERVIYKNNVLEQVICQLRFHTILKIDTEVPSDFQEEIRKKFPIYQQSHEGTDLRLPDGVTQLLPRDFLESLPMRGNLRFQFLSSDRAWTVSLTRDFVALSASEYTSWEEFRENMALTAQALINVYAPAFFTRVGLRYQNVIDRKKLNVTGCAWKELIAHHVLGPLADDELAESIGEHRNTTSFALSGENDYLRLEHGLIQPRDSDSTNHLYFLDNDLYCDEETPANAEHLTEKLNCFNAANRRVFNWCITDALRRAMAPSNSDL